VTTSELLDALWRDYTRSTPQAERIHRLLVDRGEIVHNDHVALRTYDSAGIGIAALAKPFEACGWRAKEHYRFEEKHLRARYWQHDDPNLPKIFISELCLAELSPTTQATVRGLVEQLPAGFGDRADLPWAGRPWRVTHAQYAQLLAESEYAAWVAAFGFRVNHFTVDVGALATFPDLHALVAFLGEHAFVMNTSGGVIKGSPAEKLEQASTIADAIDVAFEDATVRVPSCYYEFALRYRLPSGETFQGFVPASADKIFESTDVKAQVNVAK
jgi:Domain of unknown function (DUF1338)